MSAPHAEIAQVWPRDGRIRITGRLHGGRPDAAGVRWYLLLVMRDREPYRLRYDAAVEGEGTFDVSFPVDDLALDGLAHACWDLHLVPGTAGEETHPELLRVGRHLDDVKGKQKIYVFPAQSVTSDEDGTLVRPFYTVDDDLSLECVPGDVDLRPDELPLKRPKQATR